MGFTNIFQQVDSSSKSAWDNGVFAERKDKEEAGRHETVKAFAGPPKLQQGLNWTILAGGAFATAAVAFCRKRQRSSPANKDSQPVKSAKTMAVPETEGDISGNATIRPGHRALQRQFPTTPPPSAFDTYRPRCDAGEDRSWWREEREFSQFDRRRTMFGKPQPDGLLYYTETGKDADGPAYPPTPQVNEHIRFQTTSEHSEDTPTLATPPYQHQMGDSSLATPNTPQYWDKQDSSMSSKPHRAARQNMVHRLRQQVKSRDAMILEIHALVRDQERTIRLQELQRRELEGSLETANRSLHRAEVEIQRLTKALSCRVPSHELESMGKLFEVNNLCPNFKSGSQGHVPGRCASSPISPEQACQQQLRQQQQELQTLSSDVQRMASQLKHAEQDKKDCEMSATLKQRENELLVNRLRQAEAELEEAKKSGLEKDHRLQQFHEELIKLKVHAQTIEAGREDLSTNTMLMNLHSEVHSNSLNRKSGSAGATSRPAAESFVHNRDVVRSYNLLFAATPQPLGVLGSTSRTRSAGNDMELEADGEIIETLLVALQEEVDQLSTALGETSKVGLDKKSQASQLLDTSQILQDEEYLMNHSQFQRTLKELAVSAPEDDQDWEELSRFLSLSKGITSAAQVQELSHKLEQVARQQKVEEDILELEKHQSRIAELKERVERLSSRFSCFQDEDAEGCAANQKQTNKLASLAADLAAKLTLQEEQSQKICSEAQGLSTTAQPLLLSPYVPASKKDEIRRILKNGQADSKVTFPDRWHEHTSTSADYSSQARYLTDSEEAVQFNREGICDNDIPSAELSPFQSPVCDRKFFGISNIEDSPAVRIGSPTIAGDLRTPLIEEVGEVHGSLARILECDTDSASHAVRMDVAEDGHRDQLTSSMASTSMSPFSKMMARLDWNQGAKASRLNPRDLEDYGRHLLETYGSAIAKAPNEATLTHKFQRQTPCASYPGSLDSSFDEMLDNTLEDLVRVCSEASTTVTSPGLSTASDLDKQNEDLVFGEQAFESECV